MIRHHPLLSEEIEKGEATVAVEEEEEKADLFLRWPWWRWLVLSLLCYTHTHPHSHTTRHPCTPTHPYAHPTRHTPRHTPIPPPHTQTVLCLWTCLLGKDCYWYEGAYLRSQLRSWQEERPLDQEYPAYCHHDGTVHRTGQRYSSRKHLCACWSRPVLAQVWYHLLQGRCLHH